MPLGSGLANTMRLNEKFLYDDRMQLPIRIDLNGQRCNSQHGSGNELKWTGATVPIAAPSSVGQQSESGKRSRGNGCSATYMFLFALIICLWSAFAILLAFLYFSMADGINSYKAELRPHIHELATHVSNVLTNIDSVTESARSMLSNANTFESGIIPQVSHAVNDTARIIERMQQISEHPVLQLSLSH